MGICLGGMQEVTAAAQRDVSIIDGLSFPLSVLFGLQRIGLTEEAIVSQVYSSIYHLQSCVV